MRAQSNITDLQTLIVGYDDIGTAFLSAGLRMNGFWDTVWCETVGETISTLRRMKPDIFIIALRLAPVDGITLAQILRDARPDALIVLYDRAPRRLEVLAAACVGVDDFLRMPMSPGRILARLERCATRYRPATRSGTTFDKDQEVRVSLGSRPTKSLALS